MVVSELAALTGIEPQVIRYYVRRGLLTPSRHPGNGYKLFTKVDAKRLEFIRKAQQLGYTLAEIMTIINHAKKGNSPCPVVRDTIQLRIKENRLRLEGLMALQIRMEKALEVWQKMPNGIPKGHSICHLIESI